MFQTKHLLRQQIAARRRALSAEWVKTHSAQIADRLLSFAPFRDAEHILLYHSLPGEVATAELIRMLHPARTIYLPRVAGDRLVVVRYEGDGSLRRGSFGVFEPIGAAIDSLDRIERIIVPGVAFDRNCYRMGYGKGYYDRLIQQTQAQTIGLAFDFQLFDQIPTDPHDQPLDAILTESYTLIR